MKNAMKQALEVLKNPWKAGPDGVADAIIALEEALAKQGEPVAWRLESGKAVWFERTDPEASSALPNDVTAIPLYTTPPQSEARGLSQQQRKPLTDEQIETIRQQPQHHKGYFDYEFDELSFARAIEAAHGIKE